MSKALEPKQLQPLLEVKNITTNIQLSRENIHAVGDVSFHINPGETVGLVGESGSGKSITALSIIRLLPQGAKITSGSVLLDGKDLTHLEENKMRSIRGNEIGMIFQDPMTSLNPTKTIGEQVGEPVRIHRGANKAQALKRAEEVLGLVGLSRPKERLGDYPHQLSGGMRQRVMIAMALSCEPKLLIADEPTTALDVTIQAQILDLIQDLKSRLSMSVLLITHDMGVVAGHADRTMVMYAGRIVEASSTLDLFEDINHPYSQALLASIPQLDQNKNQNLYTIPGLPPSLSPPPQGCRFAARCNYAQDKCFQEEPPLAGPNPSHIYRCWFPTSGGVDKAKDLLPQPIQRSTSPEKEQVSFIKVSNLVKEFPVTSGAVLQRRVGTVKAVSDVSFEVIKGETFGLVGESGCGKTTIGRLIVALESLTSGHIEVEGENIVGLKRAQFKQRRRDLQLMFQDPYASLDPRSKVGEILREPLAIQKIGNKKQQRQRVAELLTEVGLPPNAIERYPHEFSGGQRQRIGLARALALNPKLIVADEPVSALDVSIRSQILNLMKRLQATHGLTYIVISHDLAVVKYLADTIGVMYLGKLVEIGPSEDIYTHAAHPYTAGLINTIPIPNPKLELSKEKISIKGELPSAINPPSGCRFRTRCPRAQELCEQVEPPLRLFGKRHLAACHFPIQPPLENENL